MTPIHRPPPIATPPCRLLVFVQLILLTLAAGCASQPETPDPSELEIEGARLLLQGEHDRALATFRKSDRTPGATFRSGVGLALCHAYLGNQALFEQYALSASAEAPQTPRAYSSLGTMYVRGAERFRSAAGGERYAAIGIEYLRRVAAADPDAPNLLLNLGVGYHLMGDDQGALVMLEEAHRRQPARLEILHVLLASLRRLGRAERVLDLLQRVPAGTELPADWQGLREWAEAKKAASPAPVSGSES